MLDELTIRAEIDEFSRSGWMDHVLSADSYWIDPVSDRLRKIRRQNVAAAYRDVRLRLHADLTVRSARLYRTLLFPVDFDVSSLLGTEQDFGRFWTSEIDVALNYTPRRCYQSRHPMPAKGFGTVIVIDNARPDEISWVETVGCQLGNHGLSEVRLLPGTMKRATGTYATLHGQNARDDDSSRVICSKPPVPGIVPIPEGPGFLENFRKLCQADGINCRA